MEIAQQNQSANKKKSIIGIVGLCLGLVSPISLGLTVVPGFILCLIGIIRKSYRLVSAIGLIVCSFWLVLFSAFTPPGSIPYPFSIGKFCMNAPAFWVRYNIGDLRKAQSQYWFFGGAGGALYFEAKKSSRFEPNELIMFAEKHGWKFQDKTQLTKNDFTKFLDEKGKVISLDFDLYFNNDNKYEESKVIYERDKKKTDLLVNITVFNNFPVWIKEDCIVLSFDTGNRIGAYSHILISQNRNKMAVYYDGSR